MNYVDPTGHFVVGVNGAFGLSIQGWFNFEVGGDIYLDLGEGDKPMAERVGFAVHGALGGGAVDKAMGEKIAKADTVTGKAAGIAGGATVGGTVLFDVQDLHEPGGAGFQMGGQAYVPTPAGVGPGGSFNFVSDTNPDNPAYYGISGGIGAGVGAEVHAQVSDTVVMTWGDIEKWWDGLWEDEQ